MTIIWFLLFLICCFLGNFPVAAVFFVLWIFGINLKDDHNE